MNVFFFTLAFGLVAAAFFAFGYWFRPTPKKGGFAEPKQEEPTAAPRVEMRPKPVEIIVPEGAKLTPAFSVGYKFGPARNKEIGVTLDADQALHYVMNSEAEVDLIGVWTLPDGRIVQSQYFREKKLLGRDVVIDDRGNVIEYKESAQ